MRARPMPMSARISSHRVFFDVRADGVRRKMQQDAARALTARAVIDQFESRNVRNEIRIPSAVAFDDSAFAAEISLFAAEAIGECEGIVENKIQITKPINHHRRICKRDESRRLISLNVKMLAPGVERRRKHTALLPFEGLLTAVFGPNTGRAAPFDHVNQLLEQIALRQSLPLRRDFAYVTVTTAPGTKQIDKCAGISLPFPHPHLDLAQVIDDKPLINRNPFSLLPYFIRRLIDVCGIFRKIQTHVHSSLQ